MEGRGGAGLSGVRGAGRVGLSVIWERSSSGDGRSRGSERSGRGRGRRRRGGGEGGTAPCCFGFVLFFIFPGEVRLQLKERGQ